MGLPFGPVGILCIGKTVEQGKWNGFAAAMGAVAVDLLYAAVAFLSLVFIKEWLVEYDTILKILIGLFLIFIGLKKMLGKVDIKREEKKIEKGITLGDKKLLFKNFTKLFMISLPNIFNIASLITVFTALEIYNYTGFRALGLLLFTMLIAEVGFWYMTTTIFHKLRERITDKSIEIFVKICAGMVMLLGVILELKVIIKTVF